MRRYQGTIGVQEGISRDCRSVGGISKDYRSVGGDINWDGRSVGGDIKGLQECRRGYQCSTGV